MTSFNVLKELRDIPSMTDRYPDDNVNECLSFSQGSVNVLAKKIGIGMKIVNHVTDPEFTSRSSMRIL